MRDRRVGRDSRNITLTLDVPSTIHTPSCSWTVVTIVMTFLTICQRYDWSWIFGQLQWYCPANKVHVLVHLLPDAFLIYMCTHRAQWYACKPYVSRGFYLHPPQ